MNIPQLLEHACRKNPQKVFLFFEDQQVTYRMFQENIYKTANWFSKMGIKKGDRVCINLPNCPEFLYIWMGLSHIGGIMVPINVAYKEKEAAYIISHSECKALVGNKETLNTTKHVRGEFPVLKWIVSIDEKSDSPNVLNFSAFRREASLLSNPADLSADDISSIMYTSGTTGRPKGVMVTHRAYTCCGQGFTFWVNISDRDRLFTCLPLYHANAQYYSTMGSLAAGASLILVNRFSASRFWDQIRRYDATIFNFIGAMIMILIKQPKNPLDSQNNIRVGYGTPALDKEIRDRFETRFGLTALAGYALTECPFGTIQPLEGGRKAKSIGLPRSHPEFENEIRIVDEQDKELPAGCTGELIIRNPTVTPGYFKDPKENQKVLKDGWLYTGDNAYRDEEGHFYFVDRKKDVIRRWGENFSSLEIEQVLNAHPKILESAVIGVPSELSDEEIKAYLIPKPEEAIDPVEIFEWCEKKIARFKVPRYLELRKSFPKTPSHRVEKYKLRQEKKDLTEGCVDREALKRH
ncbi:ATP-dependent acyl-CoA ligase [Thermodesulfobacteriota bacterium]